ncbi:MAG: hypothetical protein II144_03480, partial [Paludibacteraceae bacterium]|nr:hypothetical protein [Paludibacteraceae bacterium]
AIYFTTPSRTQVSKSLQKPLTSKTTLSIYFLMRMVTVVSWTLTYSTLGVELVVLVELAELAELVLLAELEDV